MRMVKELESSSEGRKKRDCSFFFFTDHRDQVPKETPERELFIYLF